MISIKFVSKGPIDSGSSLPGRGSVQNSRQVITWNID